MVLAIHPLYLCTCFITVLFCNTVSSDEVPIILWNVKGDALQIKPVSALGQDDASFDDTFKDILNQDANILVLAEDKLSLEDFASDGMENSNSTLQSLEHFLDSQRYMFMSSVKDPLSRIHEVHCGVKEIVVDQSVDENVLQALSFDRSCVIILHVSDTNVIGVKDPTPEDIRRVFQPAFAKNSKDVVGIFTAKKSSWGKSSEGQYSRSLFGRNLLAVEEASHFVNISGCLIMYAEKATIKTKGNNSVDLPFPVDSTGSKCGNSSALLQLNFKPTSQYTSVVVKFNFTVIGASWTTEASLVTEGSEQSNFDVPLETKDLHAPLGFSWSCGTYELRDRNYTVTVAFEGFQVQPFKVKEKFSDSFDCVTWFTVPIWMGIFVSILFIAIINCGIYALFSVHTMDRFDDPKGKTISVAAAVD